MDDFIGKLVAIIIIAGIVVGLFTYALNLIF